MLRARDQGLGFAKKVAARLATKVGWSPERTQDELTKYRAVVASTRSFRN